MIKNYFKIALRNTVKHKTYALTNILGLAVGLAACILIFVWVLDEISFDRFHSKADGIYKVMINDVYADGKVETYEAPTVKIGEALRTNVLEVEKVVQCSWNEEMLMKFQDKKLKETGIYADSTLFSMFSFPILLGDKSAPLSNINSISISEKLAHKLFNDENPIGKTLSINSNDNFLVSSVFKDLPENSSLQFDFVISFERWKNENTWANHWRSGATQAFVLLKPKADFNSTDAKVRKLIKSNCSDCTREAFLYPFSDLHLYGKFADGKSIGGRISTVVTFGCIALVILIMACFNFTNLTIALASTRNTEIGIRKSIGASRASIGLQFIGESILISFLSLLLAIVLVKLFLPLQNEIIGKSLYLDYTNPILIAGVFGIVLVCGVMAGLYPAFYLSSFKASTILKGNNITAKGGLGIRKFLIVTQFTVSIVLIIGSLIINKQLGYILKKDLGFNKERIIVIPQKEGFTKHYSSFKADLLHIPSVKNVAFVGSNLFQVPITTTDPVWTGKPQNSSIVFKVLRCDEGFIPTMNVKLIKGSNFSSSGSDSSNYIINQKAMLAMGLTKQNAIGAKLEMWNGKGKIIGLTEDFLNGNLRQVTEPLIMMFTTTNGLNYHIKTVEGSNINQTLSAIGVISKKYAPNDLFEYSFLDDNYNKEYKSESTLSKLSTGFTLVAIIICCLGLLGLSIFSAKQRTKEIGIRKVLGATITSIVVLLSKDFVKLVLTSIILAIPIAYYFMYQWLQDFAYRVNIGWVTFATAAITAILIALITVSFQFIKAALTNPVKSLRSE